MLVPPDNFGLVEEGVYRCAKLDPLNFAFLDTLNLKTLILLDAEKPPRALLNHFEDKPTALYNMGRSWLKLIETQEDQENGQVQQSSHDAAPSSGYNRMEDWMIIKPGLIIDVFEIIFNSSKHNVMIMDKTESVIGLLRKLQKWSFSSIINEYRLYAASRSTYTTETFLELLKIELVSYEENELKKKEEEESKKKKESLPKPLFNTRTSISSLSRSIEELRFESPDLEDLNFEQQQADKLSLSASPQIPHELLKLAKQRKLKKTSARDGAEQLDDKFERSLSDEQLSARGKSYKYYAYYKTYSSEFDNLTNQERKKGRIKIVLPQEKQLPHWFTDQRDVWEDLYGQRNLLL